MSELGRARLWGAGLIGICCWAAPVAAHAHGFDDPGLLVALGIAAGDVAFAVGDVVAFAGDSRSAAWLLPQAIFTTPQAVLYGVGAYVDPETPVGLAIFGDQLAAFAIYGAANRRISTTALYPLSWAIGADLALTNNALALARHSKLAPKAVATTEIVASVPQLLVAGFALGSPRSFPHQRSTLFALGGWSAALFTHGVASLIFRHAAADAPKPTPTPAPQQAHAEWRLTPGLIATEVAYALDASNASGATDTTNSIERHAAPGFVINGTF